MATSLSEIANIKGDADLAQGGFGTDAQLPEDNAPLTYLNHAADMQARANQFLAEVHNKRMDDYLSNFNNINLKDLAPGDYDQLAQQYVGLSKDLADNYDVIQNPMKNPELAGSLRAREAGLRSQIAQSQQDKGLMDVTNNHIALHPDLNTADNQKKIADYWNTPLGQRKPFSLTPASVFNIQDIADNAYKTVAQKYATATTDGKYIWKKDGIKAATPAYLAAADASLTNSDATGRSNRQLLTNAFNQLPADQQAQYDNNPLNWFHTQVLALQHPDQETSANLETNQYGTNAQEGAIQAKRQANQQAFEANESDKKFQRDLELAGLKGSNNKQVNPATIGEYKNQIYHDFFTVTNQQHPQDDPNLTQAQKEARLNAIQTNPESLFGQNISNDLLQNVYGNNTKVKVTTGDKALGSQVEQDLPAVSVIGNSVANNGQAFITLKNNKTGEVHSIYVPKEKFYQDLDNILGQKNAPTVQSASRKWLQDHTGVGEPDIDKLHSVFTAPQLKESYNTQDGKSYSHKQLTDLGYTDDQIRQAIQQGTIK